MNFDAALAQVLLFEGDYSDHVEDAGGKTRYGVTEAVAREVGYRGDMREFPLDLASRIYRDRYWDAMRCEDLPDSLRYVVFDSAVNCGVGQTTRWLQQTVGVTADGIIGPKTLAAVDDVGADSIRSHMVARRLRLMTSLPSWATFGKGWARRLCDLLEA